MDDLARESPLPESINKQSPKRSLAYRAINTLKLRRPLSIFGLFQKHHIEDGDGLSWLENNNADHTSTKRSRQVSSKDLDTTPVGGTQRSGRSRSFDFLGYRRNAQTEIQPTRTLRSSRGRSLRSSWRRRVSSGFYARSSPIPIPRLAQGSPPIATSPCPLSKWMEAEGLDQDDVETSRKGSVPKTVTEDDNDVQRRNRIMSPVSPMPGCSFPMDDIDDRISLPRSSQDVEEKVSPVPQALSMKKRRLLVQRSSPMLDVRTSPALEVGGHTEIQLRNKLRSSSKIPFTVSIENLEDPFVDESSKLEDLLPSRDAKNTSDGRENPYIGKEFYRDDTLGKPGHGLRLMAPRFKARADSGLVLSPNEQSCPTPSPPNEENVKSSPLTIRNLTNKDETTSPIARKDDESNHDASTYKEGDRDGGALARKQQLSPRPRGTTQAYTHGFFLSANYRSHPSQRHARPARANSDRCPDTRSSSRYPRVITNENHLQSESESDSDMIKSQEPRLCGRLGVIYDGPQFQYGSDTDCFNLEEEESFQPPSNVKRALAKGYIDGGPLHRCEALDIPMLQPAPSRSSID